MLICSFERPASLGRIILLIGSSRVSVSANDFVNLFVCSPFGPGCESAWPAEVAAGPAGRLARQSLAASDWSQKSTDRL